MSAILDVEDTTALVIDNGSGCIKAGYSGDETPRFNYQNLIGKPKLDVNIFHRKTSVSCKYCILSAHVVMPHVEKTRDL